MLDSLFGFDLEAGKKVKMSDVGSRFQGSSETIKSQLYDEVVDRKFFDAEPDEVRKRYRSFGIGALIFAIVLGCIGISFFSTTAPLIWLPIIVLFMLAVVMIVISSSMPKKTHLGADEAAKYRAFRTYLADIDKYDNIEAKNDIFQQYLPYAIAFGLEEDYTRKFAQAGSTTPSWYDPVPGDWDSGVPTGRRGGIGPVIIWGNSPFGGGSGTPWRIERRWWRRQSSRPPGYERLRLEKPGAVEQQLVRHADRGCRSIRVGLIVRRRGQLLWRRRGLRRWILRWRRIQWRRRIGRWRRRIQLAGRRIASRYLE